MLSHRVLTDTEEPPGRGLQERSGRQTYWRQERVRDGRTLDRGEVGGGGGQTRRHSWSGSIRAGRQGCWSLCGPLPTVGAGGFEGMLKTWVAELVFGFQFLYFLP